MSVATTSVATSAAANKVSGDVEQRVEQGFNLIEKIKDYILNNGPDVIAGILTFVVGYYIARFARSMIEKMVERANYDKAGATFVSQIVYYLLLIIFLLAGLNRMGLSTNSFIAGFGAFALAIGLALQNNMSNFASGMLILMFKPFKAGDWVSIDGIEGSVRSIQMLNTTIITKENRTIFVPNSIITSQKVVNSTYMPTRYIKIDADISYNNDHHEAIRIIKEIYKADPRVLNSDHVEVGIRAFGDNAVHIVSYPLVKSSDYLSVFYSVMSEIKDRFDRENIEIPYPQRDIYIHTNNLDKPTESQSDDRNSKANTKEMSLEDKVVAGTALSSSTGPNTQKNDTYKQSDQIIDTPADNEEEEEEEGNI